MLLKTGANFALTSIFHTPKSSRKDRKARWRGGLKRSQIIHKFFWRPKLIVFVVRLETLISQAVPPVSLSAIARLQTAMLFLKSDGELLELGAPFSHLGDQPKGLTAASGPGL